MKKITSFMIMIAVFGLLFAKSDTAYAKSQMTTSPGKQVDASPSPSETSVKNRNRTNVSNQGEESQLENEVLEQESLGKPESLRSETAKEHMSIVAKTVETLLADKELEGGIGDQVREIARTQNQAQEQIRLDLDNLGKRSGLIKKLIGPDFKSLKNLEQQLEQNRLRIQQLEQVKDQLDDKVDTNLIDEAIKSLNDQNQLLDDQIKIESQVSSLFGWLFKRVINLRS